MAKAQDKRTAVAVAGELGVSERTIRRWITEGLLPAEKRGRSFQIDLERARSLVGRSQRVHESRRRDELAELRGRYLELAQRFRNLEAELALERRRNGFLEAQLRNRAA